MLTSSTPTRLPEEAHDTSSQVGSASKATGGRQTSAGALDQLFTNGDSRFVINGSSLQIRSPSKRHDEALYVCRLAPAPNIEASGQRLSDEEQQVGRSRLAPSASSPSEPELDNKEPQAVHQSLLASSSSSRLWPATSCRSMLFGIEPNEARLVSSISIRIVGE